ncbi:MAG: tetratricopeptide repeat protein, partial [Oscillospiraceae bacterium]|nr:tetratricopeptide repeat protein [Oscillospiraceae bacterium]
VLAVAVGAILWAVLPAREPGTTQPADQTGQSSQSVNQTEPGTQQSAEDPVLEQGKAFYKAKDYEAAITNLTLALANNPESGEAYSYRGLSYFSQAKYDEAISDLIQARRYLGNNADVLTVRGISYCLTARYPEAIGDLSLVIELNPDPANPNTKNALTYRATAYEARGEMDKAAADRARLGQ